MGNEQNINVNNNIKNDNERTGRGLFYGVIAVATFIVMAVGATFAYFTATTNSGNSAVETGSTTLQLKYVSYQGAWMNRDLIPADTGIVEYSFENQSDTTISNATSLNNAMCKDDYGNSICSVYVFQVYNGANSPQNVTISVVSEENNFYNLNVMGYEIARSTDTDKITAYNNGNRYEISGETLTEAHTSSTDPRLRWLASGGTEENLIDVVDSSNTVLSLGDINSQSISEIYDNNGYVPIYVNRDGVVKTLLKYKNSSSSLVPSIDVPIATVNDPDNLIPDKNIMSDDSPENLASRTSLVASEIEIGGGEVKTFALVLYVKNENSDQTKFDARKSFRGQVIVGSGDGSVGVSGSIGAALDPNAVDNLQSNQNTQSGGTTTSSGTETTGGTEPSQP